MKAREYALWDSGLLLVQKDISTSEIRAKSVVHVMVFYNVSFFILIVV